MLRRRPLTLTVGLALALTVLLWLSLMPAQPAAAGGVVSDCSNDAQLIQRLGGGGSVTFSCGSATITLGSTQTITQNTTIDGGNTVALSGGGAGFDVGAVGRQSGDSDLAPHLYLPFVKR